MRLWVRLALAGGLLTAGEARAASPGIPVGNPVLAAQALRFEEPLVPTAETSTAEDTALQVAVTTWLVGAAADDLTPLERYVAAHPQSGWNTAVLTNLGLLYFRSGYLSKALAAFSQAWDSGKAATEVHAKAVTDFAIGRLLYLQTRLGNATTLQKLLTAIGDRQLSGAATEMLAAARQRLAYLQLTTPPSAMNPLQALLRAAGASANATAFIASYHPAGATTTLAQLMALAQRTGLPTRAIFRPLGAPVPVPSVVHWKVNHFAVVVRRVGSGFDVFDPSFGPGNLHVTADAMESESSGFFLVLGDQVFAEWRAATSAETNQVFSVAENR